jgi:hypothetical protein
MEGFLARPTASSQGLFDLSLGPPAHRKPLKRLAALPKGTGFSRGPLTKLRRNSTENQKRYKLLICSYLECSKMVRKRTGPVVYELKCILRTIAFGFDFMSNGTGKAVVTNPDGQGRAVKGVTNRQEMSKGTEA